MFLCLLLAVKLHYIVEVVSVVHVLVDKILFAINLHDDVVEASAHKYHPGCVWPWFIVTVRLIISKAVCHIKPSKKRNAPACFFAGAFSYCRVLFMVCRKSVVKLRNFELFMPGKHWYHWVLLLHGFHGREQNHVPDGVGPGEEHDTAVDADAQAARGGHTVL